MAYGITTAFVLKALGVNGKGALYSIDLPPLGRDADKFVGILVPEELKSRWRLYRGTSKRIMPKLLGCLGKVDVFIHDSLHTYRNMRFELASVTPYLQRPGVVIADDIDGNFAFAEWIARNHPDIYLSVREEQKKGLFGVAVFVK